MLVLSACGQTGSAGDRSSDRPQDITLALGFAPNTAHYWFFSALEKGFFEKRGLKVDYIVPDSTSTSIKLLTTGDAQVADAFGELAISSRAQGLPVQVVNTYAPEPPSGVVAMADEIEQFSDIEGEKAGILDVPYHRTCFDRLLEGNGLTEDEVTIIDPGFNLVPPLISGQLAMVSGADAFERVMAERESGEEVRHFAFAEVCPENVFNLVTTEQWASENTQALSDFNAAALEGLKWAMDHPAQARDIFVERFPENDPQLELAMWTAVRPAFCAPYTNSNGLGYSDPGHYEELTALFKEAGVIDSPPPIEELVTNEYLPKDPLRSEACG
jgi:putative hydroxymethylpyrimidine transport system substrate-binding protein